MLGDPEVVECHSWDVAKYMRELKHEERRKSEVSRAELRPTRFFKGALQRALYLCRKDGETR